MTQDDYRAEYKKINKNWNDSVSIYKSIVSPLITPDTVVLEAGCGFSNMYREEYKKAKRIIGVDIDESYLQANDVIQEKIVADLSNFPQVQNESVDLIISSWVLEHLKEPEKVFSEFSRVLKKGGKLVFITPNSLNYIVVLNRFMPKFLRNKIARMLTKDLTVDPMQTFYRANSEGKLKDLAQKNYFGIEKFIINGDPTYVAINKFFFYIGVLIEAILSLPLLNKTKVHIIAEFIRQ